MQIKEAIIGQFGKLQNRNISFEPGINVIYGENEAGKTTLHDFLLGMFFGMEKGRGRGTLNSMYQKHEPWHAPSYYSGALRFLVDGKPFYLERNFYYKDKKDILKNEADGEELSVAYGDLAMLLGGIFKFICVDWTNQTFSNRIEGNWMTEVQPGILKAKLTLKCFGFFRTIQKQKNLRMSDFNLGNRNLFFHKNSLKNLIIIKLYRSIHLFARKSQMLLTALH